MARRKWIWRSCPGTSLIGLAYRPRWWRVLEAETQYLIERGIAQAEH
jgi:hypothetical protein